MKIAVLSLGNLGTALAHLLAKNGHEVMAWEYDKAVVAEVNQQHINSRYLPDVLLPNNVTANHCIDEVLLHGEIIFTCIPSVFLLNTLSKVVDNIPLYVPVVNLAKGINRENQQTVMQMLRALLPQHTLAMLSGPSLANEFSKGINTVLVAASSDKQLPLLLKKLLENSRFSVRISTDVVGVELGGILKNVYAIGMGFAYSMMPYGLNFVGAYFTQALKEMQQLGVSLGADANTFYDFSGVGDLIATAMSEQSHNHIMGEWLSKGASVAEVKKEMHVLPEGFNTLSVMLTMAKEHHVHLPLAELLQQVLDNALTPEQFFDRFNACLY